MAVNSGILPNTILSHSSIGLDRRFGVAVRLFWGLSVIVVGCVLLMMIIVLKSRLADSLRRRDEDSYSLAKFSSAVMNSGSMIAITDAQGRIEYVNERFCIVSGYTAKEVIGKPLECMLPGCTPCHIPQPERPRNILKDAWEGEIRCARKSGKTFWTAVTVSAVQGNKGGRQFRRVGCRYHRTEGGQPANGATGPV